MYGPAPAASAGEPAPAVPSAWRLTVQHKAWGAVNKVGDQMLQIVVDRRYGGRGGPQARLGRPGGLAWLPVTYSGVTRFEGPPLTPQDAEAFAAYGRHLSDVEKQFVDV